MNNKYILLLVILFSCKPKIENLNYCGSSYCSLDGAKELMLLDKIESTQDTLTFNVKIWNASKTVFNRNEVENLIHATNQNFKEGKIKFELSSFQSIQPTELNIDQLYDTKFSNHQFDAITNIKTSLQIIIVPAGEKFNGYTLVLKENFENYKNEFYNTIYISDKAITNHSTLEHELGHFFGLQHTFGEDAGAYTTDEKVDGSNCHNAGDFICDTKADPNSKIDKNCNYVGNKNSHTESFDPPINNFMSYYSNQCKTTFTPNQRTRMNHFAFKYRMYLTKKHNKVT